MRTKILRIVLLLALAFSTFAQQSRVDRTATTIEHLRANITYLASDELEGRMTGSPGASAAAEYLAKEFSRIGLRRSIGYDLPGMSILEANSPRRYMQEFPFVAGVDLGRNNSMMFTPAAGVTSQASPNQLDLRLGEDWMPLGFSSNSTLTNVAATFVGYGIKADELNYNDYAGAQVTSRIAIAFEGSPDGDNPHGQFARYASVRWKAIAARNSGAAALVIIAREDKFKDEPLARLAYDNGTGDAGLPVVVISRQVATRFSELTSIAQLKEFETKLQEWITSSRSVSATSQHDIKLSVKPPLNFTLSLSTDIVRRNAAAYNVVGILDGSDPVLKKEVIVIGAHYDHLGLGGAGSLATRAGEIHHGADDNASGVAGMLELARRFAADRKSVKRTLVFIAFSGEEEGLLGSNFYVNNPIVPLEGTIAMINLDMIGRMKENKLMIGGVGTSTNWRETIAAANIPRASVSPGPMSDGPKLFALSLNEDGFGPSDHSSFYAKKIPVLFFFTGTHDDYHKPTDTSDKINYEGEARLISFVESIVRSIDANAVRPAYVLTKSEPQGRSMGFRVYLGTIPNYSESNDGLKLDGVREDSPAAKAGLRAGDRVIKMAGRDVRNVQDYTYVLGEMKAGQEYEVEVVRGTATLKFKIIPGARK